MNYRDLPGYADLSDADRAEIDRFAERLKVRDPSRCFRCGVKLQPLHKCPPCPVADCCRDKDHEGDHGAGVYARDGSFVPDKWSVS